MWTKNVQNRFMQFMSKKKKPFVSNWCLFCLNTVKFSTKEGHKYSRPHASRMHNLHCFSSTFMAWLHLDRAFPGPLQSLEPEGRICCSYDKRQSWARAQRTVDIWNDGMRCSFESTSRDAQTQTMIITPAGVKGAYRLKGLKVYFSKKGIFLCILQRSNLHIRKIQAKGRACYKHDHFFLQYSRCHCFYSML